MNKPKREIDSLLESVEATSGDHNRLFDADVRMWLKWSRERLAEESNLHAQIATLTAERDAMRKVVDALSEFHKIYFIPNFTDEEYGHQKDIHAALAAYLASQEPTHDRPDKYFTREQIDRLKYLMAHISVLTAMELQEMGELVSLELEASIRRTEANSGRKA